MSRIVIAPVDRVEDTALGSVENALRHAFAADVTRGVRLEAPAYAFDAQRKQYSAPLILRRLMDADNGADRMLAVTSVDLFIPMLSFVYGQAQLDGRLAVVSAARLRAEYYGLETDPELLAVRIGKEALHEVGHLFGLLHCPDSGCAMALSTNIRQLDLKQAAFCRGCAALALERSR